ncbi:class I SAM-dependent methyltransferase [Pseudomarimonas arenosa]|uniref:class I SAM-dependent methyltransferase n=1 Tax=Pseudomarimonas arenosa TaxID=2774145 RepID=UPI003CCD9B44
MPMNLPEPAVEARAHSERFVEQLRAVIAAEGGAIPFSRYMELALYAPGFGYYSAGATKFGASGDFITAPELGSLFARTVANAAIRLLRPLGEADVLELGGGSGAFAEGMLTHLAELDWRPGRYMILEPSADLRQRQQQRLRERLTADLFARVEWLDQLPEQGWSGLLFANEVLDALPVTRFVKRQGEVMELYVEVREQQLRLTERAADSMLIAALQKVEQTLGRSLPDGYVSELLVQLPWWLQAVTGSLQRGLALFIDYGYTRREYYLDERSQGTLVCHYRHRAHADPFIWPGLNDISSFVDFTAVAEAGLAAGLELAGFCSQASFLLGNGLEQELAAPAADEREQRARNEEARKLVLPGEMGERFRVIGLERGVDASALFAFGDLSGRL